MLLGSNNIKSQLQLDEERFYNMCGIKNNKIQDNFVQAIPKVPSLKNMLVSNSVEKFDNIEKFNSMLKNISTNIMLKNSTLKNISTNSVNNAPIHKHVSEADVYEDNSGTTLTVQVGNKLIIASDTRHSSEYNINSRNMTRIYKIGNFFLTTTGFFADGYQVYTSLLYDIKNYESHRPITLKSAACLLHNILYGRRFFPYYVYPCLSGVEINKNREYEATIYSFDSIGSYQATKCRCDGSGSKMIQPLLDSWISGKNFNNFKEQSFESIVSLVKKAFDSTAERDVKTKDMLELYIVDGENVTHEFIELRKD